MARMRSSRTGEPYHDRHHAQGCTAQANSLILRIRHPQVIGNNDDCHKYLIHDRDRIFATDLDDSIKALGIEVLRSPFASPKANSLCERGIGTVRRECLDWVIPMSEAHLRSILREWRTHYNQGRPHSSLGPGVPDPPKESVVALKSESRHRLAADVLVRVRSILGGLHHEYSL